MNQNNKYNITMYSMFVNYLVGMFVITCLLIIILLIAYYTTPNNYQLYNWSDKYKLENKINISIEPNAFYLLNYCDNYQYYLKFKIDDLNMIIKNFVKTQNIIYTQNNLIKLQNYSDIIIYNNSNNTMILELDKYI